MALRPIGAARRSAAIITEMSAERTERQQLRDLRATLQLTLDGWDAASNAQKFTWTKDLVQTVRRVIRVLVGSLG